MKKVNFVVCCLVLTLVSISACKKSSDSDDNKTATPSCSDGIQNQGETGIDCGGPCPLCVANSTKRVALGKYSSLAICNDGSAMGWGPNTSSVGGQAIGVTPSVLTGFTNVKKVTCNNQLSHGGFSMMVLKTDQTLWALGQTDYGASGTGSTQLWLQFLTQITTLSNSVVDVATGYHFSIALKSDGTVWAWGENNKGQLGDSTLINNDFPVKVKNLNNIVSITAAGQTAYALKSDGTVWAWGDNQNGQVGDSTNINRIVPVKVYGLNNVVKISAAFINDNFSNIIALKSDGSVWFWGFDDVLGFGFNEQIAPISLNTMTGIIDIANGFSHALFLHNNGTVWSQGADDEGQLGDGGTGISSYTPVQLNLSGVISVHAMMQRSYAIKNDGTLWGWGYNDSNNGGLVGDSSTVGAIYSPVKVKNLCPLN